MALARALSGTVKIDGTDDENWPWTDELTQSIVPINLALTEDQGQVSISVPAVRWGGECRVELDLTATVRTGGDIQMSGQGRFYEGDSEDTQDLEDRKDFSFIVPRNTRSNLETATYFLQLNNAGLGGGDHAEIGFGFTNYVIEE